MKISKALVGALALTSTLLAGSPSVQAATAPHNLARATILGAHEMHVMIDGHMRAVRTDPTWLLYAPDGARMLFGLATVDLLTGKKPVFRAYAELVGRGNDTIDLIIHWPSKSSIANQRVAAHLDASGAVIDLPFAPHTRLAAGLADVAVRVYPLTGKRGSIALQAALGFLRQAQG